VLLHAFPDRFTHEFLIDGANPEAKVVRQVYAALRRSASPDGSVVFDAGTLAARLPEKASDRAVESALRLLVQGGAVQAGTLARVQLQVPPTAVRDVLGDEPSPALELLRGLWRTAGARLQRGALVDLEALPAAHGGPALAMAVLDELAMLGVVSWGMAEGAVRLANPRAEADAFAVDWDGLSRRRGAALDQLATMQRYAYHEGCRRQFVLRYFGDPAGRGMAACGACDRCLGDQAPFRVIEGTARRDGGGAGRRQRGDRAARPSAPVPSTSIDEMEPEARARFDALREWRTEEARRQQKPAYVVLDNRTLQAIATMQPRTLEALGRVAGIGPAKLESYGDAVLEVLRRIG
jgi:ATP-dependent DNA helicase RecQ